MASDKTLACIHLSRTVSARTRNSPTVHVPYETPLFLGKSTPFQATKSRSQSFGDSSHLRLVDPSSEMVDSCRRRLARQHRRPFRLPKDLCDRSRADLELLVMSQPCLPCSRLVPHIQILDRRRVHVYK